MPQGRHVAIIGAGAVGVISAIEALREGHRVTLIDPGEPGGEQAASYGNAGWLSSHSVIPPAEPGVWKKVPFYLMDPLGPLAIRWSYLPKALPWLIKYLLSGWTEARVEKTAFALRDLLKDAPLLHRKLAEEAGVPELIERNGVMHVFPSRGNFDDDLGWRVRPHGLRAAAWCDDAGRAGELVLPADLLWGFAKVDDLRSVGDRPAQHLDAFEYGCSGKPRRLADQDALRFKRWLWTRIGSLGVVERLRESALNGPEARSSLG